MEKDMSGTRMTTVRLLLCCLLTLATLPHAAGGATGRDDVVYDEEIVVLRSEELAYPHVAASARIQGIVVVEVTLNDAGEVQAAAALSGPKMLVEPSVANARRWVFKPTRSKRAILLYDFRLDDAMCKSAVSFYMLRHPNVSIVTACREALNP